MSQAARILIEHQCPQCGAPVTLEETDHLFTCPFCRVKSFLANRDYFRYYLPHPPRVGKDIVFFPYWHLKGILFSSVPAGVKHKILDVSYQAVGSPHFPASMGLRTQTLKLRFVSPDMEGRFLKPGVPVQEMRKAVEQWVLRSLPKPVFDQALIGDSLSLIYSPFFVDSGVYDAVLNKAVCSELPRDFDVASLTGGHPDWQLRFIPALCPGCGWDLEGERDSLVLHCKNCQALWQAGDSGFKPIKAAHIPPVQKGGIALPFYQIEAAVSGAGISLKSYADLVREANLPKVVQDGWNDIPFRFWSPAFKVRPEDFLRFSRNLTLSQPQAEPAPGVPDGILYPVTLSLAEAATSLRINLAGFIKPADTRLPMLKQIKVRPKSALLVYLPFQEERSDFCQRDFRLRINKHLLRFAKNL